MRVNSRKMSSNEVAAPDRRYPRSRPRSSGAERRRRGGAAGLSMAERKAVTKEAPSGYGRDRRLEGPDPRRAACSHGLDPPSSPAVPDSGCPGQDRSPQTGLGPEPAGGLGPLASQLDEDPGDAVWLPNHESNAPSDGASLQRSRTDTQVAGCQCDDRESRRASEETGWTA
jgi:hypothetical protein